jgi:hypothetical protein
VIGALVTCLPIGQEYLPARVLRYIFRFHASSLHGAAGYIAMSDLWSRSFAIPISASFLGSKRIYSALRPRLRGAVMMIQFFKDGYCAITYIHVEEYEKGRVCLGWMTGKL